MKRKSSICRYATLLLSSVIVFIFFFFFGLSIVLGQMFLLIFPASMFATESHCHRSAWPPPPGVTLHFHRVQVAIRFNTTVNWPSFEDTVLLFFLLQMINALECCCNIVESRRLEHSLALRITLHVTFFFSNGSLNIFFSEALKHFFLQFLCHKWRQTDWSPVSTGTGFPSTSVTVKTCSCKAGMKLRIKVNHALQ